MRQPITDFTKMYKSQVDNCRFSAWYDAFRDVSLPTHVLPVPAEFLDYMLADGLLLPDHVGRPKSRCKEIDSDSDSDWSDEGEDADDSILQQPAFITFVQEIKDVIDSYGCGGAVFPKFNWSSPRDAHWIATGSTLRCNCVNDVLLLLKSSDFVSHDLYQPYEGCVDVNEKGYSPSDSHPKRTEDRSSGLVNTSYELVLRRWYHLQPAMEFRCFVRDNELIGISQRHHDMFFETLLPIQAELKARIETFYADNILLKFPDPSYVFDVYLGPRTVRLIDFNPFGPLTDSLMFDWQELSDPHRETQDSTELRIIMAPKGVRQSTLSYARVPREIVDMSADGKMEGFTEMCEVMRKKELEGGDAGESDSEGASDEGGPDTEAER